jgi:hypothetical protein
MIIITVTTNKLTLIEKIYEEGNDDYHNLLFYYYPSHKYIIFIKCNDIIVIK